jgi:flagellar hook-associated protein 1 FlgK
VAGILEIGISALTAFQRSLATTGHNIANADTVGYSRQRTLTTTNPPELSGVGYLGTGVRSTETERLYDAFIATQIRTAQSSTSGLESFFQYAERVSNLLADPDIGLNPAIQDFFDSLQTVSDDPASIPARQVLLAEGQSMVDRFHDLARQFNDTRDQINQELTAVSGEINNLTESVARINQSIVEAIGASGGADPNDLLDQRDVLLKELASLVDISVVPQDNGAWNLFTGKGLALVVGNAASTLATVQSPIDPTHLEIALQNGLGTEVVTDQLTGGKIGGMLDFRTQILDPGQNQLGLVAVGIIERVNAQHQLGLDLDGQFGADVFSSAGINVNTISAGATVSASFVDAGNLTSSDYLLRADDAAGNFTLTRLTDGQAWSVSTGGADPYTYPPAGDRDGFNFTISGAAAMGDEFLIQPTRAAAQSLDMQLIDPRKFAAAGAVRAKPTGNALSPGPNLGTASITQPESTNTTNLPVSITLQWTADLDGNGTADDPGFQVTGGPGGTLAYDPATDSTGAGFSFPGYGGMSFRVSGAPLEGDRFVIETNAGGIGDNRNALHLAELQNRNLMLGDTGGVAPTASFQDVYAQLVSDVGSRTRHAEVNARSSAGLLERHEAALSSISGVNLDEEAANLIRYQQAYQAAAQVIAVANTVFDALIDAVRR